MQRGETRVQRITVKRQFPARVPCTYAEDFQSQWKWKLLSCGARIPYAPTRPCPVCGRKQARGNAPPPGDDSWIIDRDVAIVDADTGEVVVLYVDCAADLATDLAAALRPVEWDRDVYGSVSTTTRLSGIAITHRTFGYAPPSPMRRRWGCSRSQFNVEYPDAMTVLAEFCRVSEHVFRTQATEVYNRTAESIVKTQIPDAWRIAGTPWTSGIINKTATLPYHRDQANIPKSWSAMLGCRRGVEGGLLHLADYDVYLPINHGSITIFDGQSVVHGVSPITSITPAGWRYTVVTYAKSMMRHCCPDPKGEVKRAALAATMAEDIKAKRAHATPPPKRRPQIA